MLLLDILYNIVIMPIELLIQFIYVIANRICANPGICIIVISLAVNLLCLPLYKRSDALQDQERKKQAEMKPRVDRIKAAFKGEERFMMLSTYYRQVGYKPIHALRGSLSLLLQIPFFIAAFHFLSNLADLQGVSFLFLPDLGSPDGLLVIGDLHINLMPILMTTINIISGAIYTHGFPAKDKMQLYAIAVVFLALLYNSPSGLVFYWTLNNLFGLFKNLFMKAIPHKESKRNHEPCTPRKPAIAIKVTKSLTVSLDQLSKPTKKEVLLLLALFSIFLGAYIPLTVISSSPSDFVSSYSGPLEIVLICLSRYIGCALWIYIFYQLMPRQAQPAIAFAFFLLLTVAFVCFFIPSSYLGRLSSLLVFDEEPSYPTILSYLNVLQIVACTTVVTLLFLIFRKAAYPALVVVFASMLVLCAGTGVMIFRELSYPTKNAAAQEQITDGEINPIISLSSSGQNVVVLMLDRCVSEYVPYLFGEEPGLLEDFSGFVYYPNTLTYARNTNNATPALFGGYEYTPARINQRPDESLATKQNEALSVLPVLFSRNGFSTTVCDPPYAGYQEIPDISIYDEYEGISAYITAGVYPSEYDGLVLPAYSAKQNHNFFYYALFKCSPAFAQPFFYDGGAYLQEQSNASSYNSFLKSYSVLNHLCDLTSINDSEEGSFLMMQNSTTHSPCFLSSDYTPSADGTSGATGIVDSYFDTTTINLDDDDSVMHFHVDMASFMQLGKWFEYLKANNVYDNTRIIIVSDHGTALDSLHFATSYNMSATLLVKDFDATGTLQESFEFMTTADVAQLATSGVIENASNPFSGKLFSDTSDKNIEPQLFTTTAHWNTTKYNGNLLDVSDGIWIGVQDSIFDISTWIWDMQVE